MQVQLYLGLLQLRSANRLILDTNTQQDPVILIFKQFSKKNETSDRFTALLIYIPKAQLRLYMYRIFNIIFNISIIYGAYTS